MLHALSTIWRTTLLNSRGRQRVRTQKRQRDIAAWIDVERLEDRSLLTAGLGLNPMTSAVPTIVTTDAPSNHVLPASDAGLDGVVSITMAGIGSCSGTLLPSGRHVLTAAHCLKGVDTVNGQSVPYEATAEDVTVTFNLASGPVTLQADELFVHASWSNTILAGNDVAIIELDGFAPIEADRYDILRVPLGESADEIDLQTYGLIVGYGNRGTGEQGEIDGTYGTKRYGWNRFEASNLQANPYNTESEILYYDFDNGETQNDALGALAQQYDLGLGDAEANMARGDSGGPVFVNGLIGGITSGGVGDDPNSSTDPLHNTDVHPGTNFSFGEIGFNTRVTSFAHWIDTHTGAIIDDGDAGFSSSGFQSSGLVGYQGDSMFGYGGTATYSFTGLEPGWYQVSTITPGEASYTTNAAVYAISNGIGTVEVIVDQRLGLKNWHELDFVEVPAGASTLTITVSQGGSGAVRADAIRVQRTPDVLQIDDGDTGFSAPGWQPSSLAAYQGDSVYGYSGSATYTFSNVTPGWYRVSANTPGHANSSNNATYTITAGGNTQVLNVDQRPGTNGWSMLDFIEVPEGTSTVTVRLKQGGGASGALRSDAMRLERIATPSETTIDDGDAGFSTSGYWSTSGLKGYDGDSRYAYSGSATYDFSGLAPGEYQVLVQRPGHQYSSSNARYTVTSGANSTATNVDQRTGTSGWQELASITVPENSDDIRVVLSQGSGGSGALRADAIRIVSTDTFFDRYERQLLAELSSQQQTSGGSSGSSGSLSEGAGQNTIALALSSSTIPAPADVVQIEFGFIPTIAEQNEDDQDANAESDVDEALVIRAADTLRWNRVADGDDRLDADDRRIEAGDVTRRKDDNANDLESAGGIDAVFALLPESIELV